MAETEIDREEKQAALRRVVESDEFGGAERLRAFLTYVVEQELAGRPDMILGKRILEGVYHKGPCADGAPENVVRVDATRLRQRLDLYYGTEGREDPVRIYIDKGGYTPRFELRSKTTEPAPRARPAFRVKWVLGGTLVAGLAAAVYFSFLRTDTTPEALSPEARSALFENNPTNLLARNMTQEARGLLFPAPELVRVSAALDMFEEAMRLDPNYYGSYAGASQASTILAGLSPNAEMRQAYMQSANELAERALELDSTKSWSHSARAFSQMVRRDFASAQTSSRRALELEPDDLYALEIDAIISVFSGDFERAIANANPKLHQHRPGRGLPWRNTLGNAYFHAGEYQKSITHLTQAVRSGGPISEINTAHLIAAYQASGQHEKAREMVVAFQTSWPESRVSQVLKALFEDIADAERVLRQLAAAGWIDPVSR